MTAPGSLSEPLFEAVDDGGALVRGTRGTTLKDGQRAEPTLDG